MNAPNEGPKFTIENVASIEAEQAILGGLMLDNGLFDLISDMLQPDDFFRPEHRMIYGAISAQISAGKPCDVITVFEAVKQAYGEIDLFALNALAAYVPSKSNVHRYAEMVRERSLSRRLHAISVDIGTLALKHEMPLDERIEHATGEITKLLSASPDDVWEPLEQGMVRFMDRIQEEADGAPQNFVSTGLSVLDDITEGGLRPGELVVIGARPGMGKTAFATTIAGHVARTQGAVGFFSFEMKADEVVNRMVAAASSISLGRVRRADRLLDSDWSRVTEGVEQLRSANLFVSDSPGLNIHQIRARARALRRRGGLKLMVIDYLGLVVGTDPKMLRVYQLEQITQGLKGLAKELDIPVLLLVQVNREAEKRSDQLPILSDLRDSGAIEQDADIVIFLHRPVKANPDLGSQWENYAKVSVAKQRNGSTGILHMRYVGEFTRFMDWPVQVSLPTMPNRARGCDL